MIGPSTDAGYAYLKPGEWHFGNRPGLIRTVLGSCVAVTMFHRSSRQFAICHAVMPMCDEDGHCRKYCEEHTRYTGCIIPRMAESFFEKGIQAKEIEVKLFGGSHSLWGSHGNGSVGNQNIQQARRSLVEGNLLLRVSDIGGIEGRKLLFDTATGVVRVKRLGGSGVYRASDFLS